MTHTPPEKPTVSPHGRKAAEQRRRREAEALRANLARRKQRDRALGASPPKPAAGGDPLESKPNPDESGEK